MPIDLTGQYFKIAQNAIEKGQGLNLDFSVINNGNEKAAPFSFDIVISKDDEISEDDFKLGNYVINTSPEAGELKSYRYHTPAADHPFWQNNDDDIYTVGIRIDPQNDFFEYNEDNNSNVGLGIDYGRVKVTDFGLSDLKGKYIDVANSDITPGGKIDLRFVVENDSHNMANPFSIDIYLTSGLDPETADKVKIGTYDIRDGIEGNDKTELKRYIYTAPELGDPIWEKGDGNYHIAFDIDSKHEVDETNEDNNSGQGKGLDYTKLNVTGIDQAADLVVKSFSAPENAKAGDTVEVEYEIVNEGGKDADFFAAGFYLFGAEYLANNESLDRSDIPEVVFSQGGGNSGLFSLAPHETTGIVKDTVTLPDSWAGYTGAGDYYLGVEADTFDDVDESSDLNNSLTAEGIDYQKVSIMANNDNTVDLVGTHFEVVQDQIIPGHEFDLGFVVKNEGLAAADPFYFDLYLSQDAHIDPHEDFYLGRYDIRDGLGGEEDTGLKSIRYTAPDAEDAFWGDEDATYYAGMVIDPANNIVESNEDNNSNEGLGKDYSSVAVTGLDKIADLKTVSFDVVEETIKTGSDFTISYEIINDGTESADLFGAGFFVFTEDYLMNNDSLKIEDVPKVLFLDGNNEDRLISLDPGETFMNTTTMTLPEDWAGFAGGSDDYLIGVAADVYGDIAESNEMNNSLTGEGIDYETVSIMTKADLKTVSFDVVEETIDTGSDFTISYEITNDGTESADLFGAGFFIFTEDYLMNNDSLKIEDVPEVLFLDGNNEDRLISLDPGETFMNTTTMTLPEDWAGFTGGSGDYLIGVAADVYGDIAESNEMNNSLVGLDIDYQKVAINVMPMDT